MKRKPAALTIAGSDPSGGAGIQADLKVFHQFGVYGMGVISLLTVQNTRGVRRVDVLDPRLVRLQIEAVLEDIRPQAVKTGALGSAGVIREVAAAIKNLKCPVVVDTVMVSKHGAPLLEKDACDALRKKLLPQAALVTPNLREAEILTGMTIRTVADMKKAAGILSDGGARGILIKGGHLAGEASDLLFYQGTFEILSAEKIRTRHTHGTGCSFSAALTACLAKGETLPVSVRIAKRYITRAIGSAPRLGRGMGPVNHHASCR